MEQTAKLWNGNYLKVWSANFLMFFAFYLLTPLLPLYLRDAYQADKAMTGVVLSGYTLVCLMVRPFSGYIVDSFPRKKVLLWCYFFFALFFAGYFVTGSLVLFAVVRTMHGAPFGGTTVANSTMAIDVLPSERRAEGIGYYGLSNNIAMAIGPTIGLFIYDSVHDFNVLFAMSLVVAMLGFVLDSTIKCKERTLLPASRPPMSLDRFFLVKGWSQGIVMAMLSFAFGVISTYLAIYSRDVMHISASTGSWFALLSVGLMMSRLVGGRSLRKGKIVENASWGMTLSVFGYLLFVSVPSVWGYYGAALIVGLGNGHMFPAMQNVFINLATNDRRGTANSTLLTSWDVGIGLGIIAGGAVAEAAGYTAAFWLAFAVNASGVVFFWLYSRGSFIKNRLR